MFSSDLMVLDAIDRLERATEAATILELAKACPEMSEGGLMLTIVRLLVHGYIFEEDSAEPCWVPTELGRETLRRIDAGEL